MDKDKLLKAVVAWMRKNKAYPSLDGMEDAGIFRRDIRREFKNMAGLEKALKKSAAEVWAAVEQENERLSTKAQIVESYAALAKKLNRPPMRAELAEELDIDTATINKHVRSMENLHAVAMQLLPDEMGELFSSDLFTPERFQKQLKVVKKHKRFFITTAVSGCRVDVKCWESLMAFCEDTERLPIFLPIADPARAGFKGVMFFDTILRDEVMVFDDFRLNSNCYVSNVMTSAKQIIPTTGLTRIGDRAGAFIYASPKLSLESVANASSVPLQVITTGAITEPDYTTDKYMSNRTAYIAHHDHQMAGIVVDIIDDKVFHWRPVEFDAKGRLVDLNAMYDGVKKSVAGVEALVYPDVHVEEMDRGAAPAFEQIIDFLKPKRIAAHDTFDGFSINPHNRWRNNTKAKHWHSLNVESEITSYVLLLNRLCKKTAKWYEVASNHPERIDRWVEDGAYIKDPQNYAIGHELASAMLEDKIPLEAAARKRGLDTNVVFLQRDESLLVAGVELGYHGDIGDHGSRGNLEKLDRALGKCFTGHSHVPRIFRRAWSVGTASILRQGWNKGPQAWCHTVGVVYSNGSRQLINIIGGAWRSET